MKYLTGYRQKNIRTLRLVLRGTEYRFGVIDMTGISTKTKRDKMNYCNDDIEVNGVNYYCKQQLGHDGDHSYQILSGDWKKEARRYCQNADFWREKFESLSATVLEGREQQ